MRVIAAASVFLSLWALSGCGSNRRDSSIDATVTTGSTYQSEKRVVKAGEEFEIKAPEIRSLNKKWELTNISESYVKLIRKEYRQVDGVNTAVFKLKAMKEGSTLLQLMLKDPRKNSILNVEIFNTFLRIDGEKKATEGAFINIYSRGEFFDFPLAQVGIYAQRKTSEAYGYQLVAANTSNVYEWHDLAGLKDLWSKPFGLYYCEGNFRLQEGGMSKDDSSLHLLVNDLLSCRPATAQELKDFGSRYQR